MSHIVLVVVPDGEGRYLIVQERDGTFYLPAGRVEPNESLVAAAVRETAEEAGVAITLRGLLGFEHEVHRMRFCFIGEAPPRSVPKATPDRHTRGAAWLTKRELAHLPLRHPEVLGWIERAERATSLLPCAAYAPLGLT